MRRLPSSVLMSVDVFVSELALLHLVLPPAHARRVSKLRSRSEKQGVGRKKALEVTAILISNPSFRPIEMCKYLFSLILIL